jgi:hypothetical protein
MRSFAAQERERKDDDDFEMATHKTPEAVRKQTSKAPPPLPATVAEVLQLLWRMSILTEGLFTEDCSLAIQLRDMHKALKKREQKLMGDLTAADELIPQLAWAITSTARDFYGTVSTREDIDPPDDKAPQVAIAQLSIYTQMFQAGYTLNLTNIPDPWRRKHHQLQTQPQNQRNAAVAVSHRATTAAMTNDMGPTHSRPPLTMARASKDGTIPAHLQPSTRPSCSSSKQR